jgi:hypothetical protein
VGYARSNEDFLADHLDSLKLFQATDVDQGVNLGPLTSSHLEQQVGASGDESSASSMGSQHLQSLGNRIRL